MKLLRPFFLIFAAACVFAGAQTTQDDAAQRQLREDRERFVREVERQATEAKIRDSQARAADNEQRTREQLERLRAQQSAHTAETSRISPRLTEASPPLPPLTRTSSAPESSAVIVPDFSVTFLTDGNCVLYVKGRPPEVKSPAETGKAIQLLLNTRKIKPEVPRATP